LDDKFLALRSLPPERYYAAAGVYFHVAAATWREAERKPAVKVCPDAASAIADLQADGLLDSEGCVSRRAFAHSVGRAKANRRTAADRVARNRAGMSRVSNANVRVTNGDVRVSNRLARDTVVTVTEGSVGSDGNSARETNDEPSFDSDLWGRIIVLAEELTGIPYALGGPHGGLGAQALSQASAVPWATFEAGWRKVAAVYGRPTARQLVFDGEDVLRPTGRARPAPPSKDDRERAEARRALGLT
jgi:hypothetical protein